MHFIRLAPLLLILTSCGKDQAPENELPVNAMALSRVSNLLADRETYWWSASGADTLMLYDGVQYGTSVAFYHIHGTDTTNVTEQVLSPDNRAFLFWEASDSSIQIDFKSGLSSQQGLNGFIQATESGGPFLLNLVLRYQADTMANTGDLVLFSTFPVLVE
ncbi:MAG: hypothetical protein IT261_10170 [Saprospiraceae bacterium]|nr:hypothetical protein [Saprospiraceae bacterium]